MPLRQHVLTVDGMTCAGCEQALERSLEGLEGVVDARPDHRRGRVAVRFDPDLTSPAELGERVQTAGYELVE